MALGPFSRLLVVGLILTLAWGFAVATPRADSLGKSDAEPTSKPDIGTVVPEVDSLRDLKGNRRTIGDFRGYQAYVAIFLGTECPLANLYVPRVVAIEKEYRDRGVQFLAIYPNEADTLDRAAAHAYDRNIPFPVLKDFEQGLANAVGVRRTPEVCVWDAERKLRYRGRVDDQYSVGARRQTPSQRDLVDALDAILAGREIERTETSADGCLLGRHAPKPARGDLTYEEHVAPILENRCQGCHRPGRSGSFTLTSFEDAVEWSEMIREVTSQRRMPPWHADPRHGTFSNDRSLSNEELEILVAWTQGDKPRGKRPSNAPPPPRWHQGWNIGAPDMVFAMPKEFTVPADGVLPYKMFVVPTQFTEDRWVTMAEAMPGNPGVVHHIIVYMISPERLDPVNEDDDMSVLVAWAPGDMPLACPPGTGLRVPKGTELLFEMHYTPNGAPGVDRSSVGIKFCSEKPEREIHTNMFANQQIRIPPRDPHFRAEKVFVFPEDAKLMSLIPHMHWRGKSYHYEAIFPDGRKEVLLSVPRWDFNWQTAYLFAEPVRVPKGTEIRGVAHWDNTKNNPFNPDPNIEVGWGLQTWDEMMVGWMTYVWEKEPSRNPGATARPNGSELVFQMMDRNKDGLIQISELPAKIAAVIPEIGLDPELPITPVAFKLIYGMMHREMFGSRAGTAEKE